MSAPFSRDSSSTSRSQLVSSPDPRLCPRVMVDVDTPQGRALTATHMDTVKVVHSYLRAKSPNPMTTVLDPSTGNKPWKEASPSSSGCQQGGGRLAADTASCAGASPGVSSQSVQHLDHSSGYRHEPCVQHLDHSSGYCHEPCVQHLDHSSGYCHKPCVRHVDHSSGYCHEPCVQHVDHCSGYCHEPCVQHVGYLSSSKHKQLTAYVAWVNSQLKKKPGAHQVEDLRHDIRDGVALVDLIQVIAGEILPDIHQAPSSHAEMRENVDKVLQFMASRKVKMHHITTRDIVEGNLKAIMRLILALAAHYKPNSVRHSAQSHSQTITGIAQGAAAALTEARRNATRAGHRYRRRRPKEDVTKQSERRIINEDHHDRRGRQADVNERLDEDRASDNSSPVSSQNASPRASLYLSDPPSSMEGLLSVSGAMHRGGIMVTSCESDSAMGDSGYAEICDCLKETHEALFQLHELLLTGDSSGDAKTLSRGDLEGANSKETIIILKGRLLHAEEVAESLRADLSTAKSDCLELQGTKAGLQQRLKEQESTLSGLKSQVMTLELEKDKLLSEMETLKKQLGGRDQDLSDVKMSCVKQVEDKDRVAGDLKRELLKQDHTIHQLQEQMSQMKESMTTSKQATELMVKSAGDVAKVSTTEVSGQVESRCHDQRLCVLTDCLNKLTGHDKAGGLKSVEFEAAKDSILQSRVEVWAPHASSATIDQLEDTVVKLLDQLHIHTSSPATTASSRSSSSSSLIASNNKNVTTPARRSITASSTWRSPASRDTPRTSARGRVQSSPSNCGPSGRGSLRNVSQNSQPSVSRGQQGSLRGCAAVHVVARSGSGVSKVARSQIPRPQGARKSISSPPITISDAQTSVLYYVDQSEKALSCVINKPLGDIRLHDFKSVIEDSNLYHYFFKVLDPEYGTVKAELSCDDDILPGWEGKIVAWLELETGTSC